MNFIDYLILIVLLVSLLLGFFRGFLSEAIGLISWLGGLWLAWHYAYLLEPHLGGLLSEPPFATWAARLLILLAVLVLGWLIAGIASYFAHQSGISLMLDRLLGVVFGLIRGMVLIAIVVMLGKQVQLDRTDWWRASRFMPPASEVSDWVKGFADSAVKVREQMQADDQPVAAEE
jgi:membrane protein required for colicin V production